MAVDVESLPALDSEYPVSEEQVREYRQRGHVLLRGVATPDEAAAYRPAIGEAVDQNKRDYPPLEDRDTYGKAFIQVGNLWEGDAAVRRFVFARRFAGIAARLLGADAVRLYHDQALFKEPGGGHTPWHQDQFYWPLEGSNSVTMWMPLVDVDADMGTMAFADGSHARTDLEQIAISDESEAHFNKLVAEQGWGVSEPARMAAGDATFHSGWCLHRAPGNNGDRTREVMTVIYFADGTRLMEPDNPNRRNDLERWHPGQQPSEFAASPLNPILWSKDA